MISRVMKVTQNRVERRLVLDVEGLEFVEDIGTVPYRWVMEDVPSGDHMERDAGSNTSTKSGPRPNYRPCACR